MTDKDQKDVADKGEKESADGTDNTASIGGVRLAEARRSQNISVQEIAAELHIDEPKVRALESNEFDVLGAAVFAKGHLRKYAQLVGVAEAQIDADYEQLNDANEAPQFVAIGHKSQREFSPLPWLALFVVVIVVGLAYWWISGQGPLASSDVDSTESEVSLAPALAESTDRPTTIDLNDEIEIGAAANDVPDTARDEDAQPAVVNAAADAIAEPVQVDADEIRIRLEYTGNCWTEITDADGRRLFFDLGSAGRSIDLSGKAPLNVLFGDASNVSLTVNGEPHAIENIDRRGTARMTLLRP